MSNGKYIVLEGPEGVGKTTQIQELAMRLQKAGLPVRVLREPDSQSDLTARAIRQLTQDPRYPMNTRTEVLLYNAARSQSLQIIKKSVEQGLICIVDRNYLTTLAIQYYGRGDVPDYNIINNIISFAVDGVEPDLCIVMDAPVQPYPPEPKIGVAANASTTWIRTFWSGCGQAISGKPTSATYRSSMPPVRRKSYLTRSGDWYPTLWLCAVAARR